MDTVSDTLYIVRIPKSLDELEFEFEFVCGHHRETTPSIGNMRLKIA